MGIGSDSACLIWPICSMQLTSQICNLHFLDLYFFFLQYRRYINKWNNNKRKDNRKKKRRIELFINHKHISITTLPYLKDETGLSCTRKTSTRTYNILKHVIMSDFPVITRVKRKYPKPLFLFGMVWVVMPLLYIWRHIDCLNTTVPASMHVTDISVPKTVQFLYCKLVVTQLMESL